MRRFNVVSAIITDDDWMLLVKQRRPDRVRQPVYQGDESAYFWGFPGGKVEQGETTVQGLSREIHEETGLIIPSITETPVLTCVYGDNDRTWECSVTGFHLNHPVSELSFKDPDNEVIEPCWFRRADAIAHIERIPWLSMREPILHYLTNGDTGLHWQYLMYADGSFSRMLPVVI